MLKLHINGVLDFNLNTPRAWTLGTMSLNKSHPYGPSMNVFLLEVFKLWTYRKLKLSVSSKGTGTQAVQVSTITWCIMSSLANNVLND